MLYNRAFITLGFPLTISSSIHKNSKGTPYSNNTKLTILPLSISITFLTFAMEEDTSLGFKFIPFTRTPSNFETMLKRRRPFLNPSTSAPEKSIAVFIFRPIVSVSHLFKFNFFSFIFFYFADFFFQKCVSFFATFLTDRSVRSLQRFPVIGFV